MHRRTFLKHSGALGAAAAVSASLSACSSGPESTNDTGDGGGKQTLTAVIGYGNDGSWHPTQTASTFCMAANNESAAPDRPDPAGGPGPLGDPSPQRLPFPYPLLEGGRRVRGPDAGLLGRVGPRTPVPLSPSRGGG